MSLAVRFIRTYLHWEMLPEDRAWLKDDEIPADPLSDLNTDGNALSIYLIDDDKSELNRCIAAYATCKNRGYIREIDYLLFEERIIRELEIKTHQSDAKDLIDERIKKLHWDMYELSSQRLVELAKTVLPNNEVNTLSIDEVCQLINDSIKNGWINIQDINKGIDKDMKKYC